MEKNPVFLCLDIARMFRRNFADLAHEGGTGAQWRALMVLERRAGISQAVLAEELDVEPITACRLVDRMQQAGLVERRSDPNDRRAWQLHLSDEAKPIVQGLHAIGSALVSDACEGLSNAELDVLDRILSRVRDNLACLQAGKKPMVQHG